MNQKKTDDPMQIFQKTVSYNSILIEAMFEILAEKNVLTGEEVLERIKKLRDDGLSIPGWVN
jgi:DNA-binding Lrp family transcriptional regulator